MLADIDGEPSLLGCAYARRARQALQYWHRLCWCAVIRNADSAAASLGVNLKLTRNFAESPPKPRLWISVCSRGFLLFVRRPQGQSSEPGSFGQRSYPMYSCAQSIDIRPSSRLIQRTQARLARAIVRRVRLLCRSPGLTSGRGCWSVRNAAHRAPELSTRS